MRHLDVDTIEKKFFKGQNPLKRLLKVSLELFAAKHTGILYGTNDTKIKFLPTSMWDRGIMDRFDGKGLCLKNVRKPHCYGQKTEPCVFL